MFCRYIKLQNGMRVLLVSDPTVQTSAAALDVKVGSFYDPSNLQVSSIFNITFETSSLKYLNPFFCFKKQVRLSIPLKLSQGLCHLCEHVLFTGSELFPNESYSGFLAERGGSSDAWTDAEHTNFR